MNAPVKYILLIVLFVLPFGVLSQNNSFSHKQKKAYKRTNKYLQKATNGLYAYTPPQKTKIDTIFFKNDTVCISFTDEFAYKTLRKYQVQDVYAQLKRKLRSIGRKNTLQIFVKDFLLEDLVRATSSDNQLNRHVVEADNWQHVKNVSKSYQPTYGLNGKHIALWNSHGWYYENKLDRWEWQRAHMFTTIEDLLTTSYVLPFLTPMLENAGANVCLPRERDIQTREIIVDESSQDFLLDDSVSIQLLDSGFLPIDTLFDNQNPFKMGKSYQVNCLPNTNKYAIWKPKFEEDGNYAVYVAYKSFKNSSRNAEYSVVHSGGITRFVLNQSIGGGTWIYLGTFNFKKDKEAVVKLSLKGKKDKVLSLDAVRFGGGMGNVARNGKISRRPRWNEAARYYLQYSGAPDSTIYSKSNGKSDYTDDYRSRGHWVNYLSAPIDSGKGLGIPIDLSFAFHTDAGHKKGIDQTVGTLLIYSTTNLPKEKLLKNGSSRLVNRDFADFVSNEIVHDIRKLHNKDWTQREMWDKRYSEATFPDVPSALLELLSHHNLGDSRYALDPNFRFTVSRAIYKSMLKFLANYYQKPYVVQPLPIKAFSATVKSGKTQLRWSPQTDALESTAIPHYYIVYTKKEDNGWDNGTFVSDTAYLTPYLEKGEVYSYKITAVNEGGESFPSTELSVAYNGGNAQNILLVDGFDRVAAPELTYQGSFAGYTWISDEGVAWGLDYATTGKQYRFNEDIPWIDDDNPGHGASFNNLSDKTFAGNQFNHTWFHATSINQQGYNVSSINRVGLSKFKIAADFNVVDIILGEQKTTILPDSTIKYSVYDKSLIDFIKKYTENNRQPKLIISGAYIGSDLFISPNTTYSDEDKDFVKNTLGFAGMSDNASFGSQVYSNCKTLINIADFDFNKAYQNKLYRVESPDAIVPANENSVTILRYLDNNKSAAVYFKHKNSQVISIGFPLETITSDEKRDAVFRNLFELLQ